MALVSNRWSIVEQTEVFYKGNFAKYCNSSSIPVINRLYLKQSITHQHRVQPLPVGIKYDWLFQTGYLFGFNVIYFNIKV